MNTTLVAVPSIDSLTEVKCVCVDRWNLVGRLPP